MRVDFLQFGSRLPYQLSFLTEDFLGKALSEKGVAVRYIRESSHTIRQDLQKLWSDPPDWTLSCEYAPERDYHFQDLVTPHLHLLLNDPYPFDRKAVSKQFFSGPDQKEHFAFQQAVDEKDMRSRGHRGKTAFFGSFRADLRPYLLRDFSPPIVQKIIEVADSLQLPEEAFAVESYLLLGVNIRTIYFLINYLQKRDLCHKMLQSCENQRVAIYGSTDIPSYYAKNGQESWKEWIRSYKNFSFHGPLPANEIIQEMSKYDLILDPTPPRGHGVPLRLLQGLTAGCRVLTYKNPQVLAYFGRGKGVQYFGEEDIPQDVSQGQEIVRAHFTWKVRAQEIINALS